MELPRGITGFRNVDDKPLPASDIAAFRKHCYTAARWLAGRVSRIELPSSRTRNNFASGILELPEGPVAVLLNAHFPVIGFAEPLREHEIQLRFVDLANAELEIGEAMRWTGQPAEARACYERALAILTRLIDAQPAFADHLQIYLVFGWKGLGATQQAAGQPAEAVASWRRAVATDEHVRASLGEALYYLAGCHARLGGIAGAAGSGLPASEGPAELDRAMALLRRAAENGYGNVSEMRRDPDLDPLRGRPDFQAMMADLAFPAQPFAIDGEPGGGTGNGPMISLRPYPFMRWRR